MRPGRPASSFLDRLRRPAILHRPASARRRWITRLMVRLVEQIADWTAAMIPPIGEPSPFLGRETFGNLEVEVLHSGTGAAFGVRLLALRCQELLPVERLGGEGLGRLLARGTHLSSERAHPAALLVGQLPNLLAPVRRKRA